LGGIRSQPSESARVADSQPAESSHAPIDRRGLARVVRPRIFHLAEFSLGHVARVVWPQMGFKLDWIWNDGPDVRRRAGGLVGSSSPGNPTPGDGVFTV